MSKRKVYRVTHSDDGWKVKGDGNQRASSIHETKAEAVAEGKRLAKNNDLGQIVIHKKDGHIQTEHTYGSDPYPPKG